MVAVWDPSSAAKACCGDRSLSSQSTHRLGVWSDVTRLALCHLFPGLLNTGQVKHPCLADAAFLETTGKSERGGAVGFQAQEAEVPSDWGAGYKLHIQPILWYACSFVLFYPV